MADQFIGIGGTGQHVAMLLARLVHLGAVDAKGLQVTIIDADDGGDLANALRTFSGHAPPVDHPLRGVNAFLKPYSMAAMSGSGASKTTFRALMLDDHASDDDRQLFDALFALDQQKESVAKGFYAKPSIGATAFAAHNADAEGILANLRARCAGAGHVFITGSFIGGTGAGVIPSVIGALGDPEKWYGAFLLNWLDAGHATGPNTVTSAVMAANMRHGLEYFYSPAVRKRLKAATLLGPPPTGETPLTSASSREEGETRSYYHLLACRAYYKMTRDAVAKWKSTVLAAGHDRQEEHWLLDRTWAGDISLRDRLRVAARTAEWVRAFCEPAASRADEWAGELGSWGFPSARVPRGLHDLDKWRKRGRDESVELFATRLFENLLQRAAALQDCVEYFVELFGPLGEHVRTRGVSGEAGLKEAWKARQRAPKQDGDAAAMADALARALHAELLSYLQQS